MICNSTWQIYTHIIMYMQNNLHTKLFIAALFKSKDWLQPKPPSIGHYLNCGTSIQWTTLWRGGKKKKKRGGCSFCTDLLNPPTYIRRKKYIAQKYSLLSSTLQMGQIWTHTMHRNTLKNCIRPRLGGGNEGRIGAASVNLKKKWLKMVYLKSNPSFLSLGQITLAPGFSVYCFNLFHLPNFMREVSSFYICKNWVTEVVSKLPRVRCLLISEIQGSNPGSLTWSLCLYYTTLPLSLHWC